MPEPLALEIWHYFNVLCVRRADGPLPQKCVFFFSESVHPDVECQGSALDGQRLLIVEGSGWRERRESPRWHPLWHLETRVTSTASAPQPPEPPEPPPRFKQVLPFFCVERMTVAMALAENLHHSRQKVEGGAHEGPRAQKTVRVTGARPGVLKELEPQGRTVTDGYVAVPVPSLAVPLLARAAGEAVDSSSLRYITASALRQKEEEERQKELKEREEAKERADEMQSLLAVPRALRPEEEKEEDEDF